MSKKVIINSYTIIVLPRRIGDFGSLRVSDSFISQDEAYLDRLRRERAEDIVKQIQRHVDDVDSVYAEPNASSVCEHCGSYWSEDDDNYNGGCCDKDEAMNPTKESVQS